MFNISESISSRINIFKAICIIFVLFIHSGNAVNIGTNTVNSTFLLNDIKLCTSRIIAAMAVPGFFFISSILLYRKIFNYKANTIKKIKTIVIPFILVNTFWICLFWIAQKIPATSAFFVNENNTMANWHCINWINAFLGIPSGVPLVYPLWFLRNLFLLNLLSPIFLYLSKFPKIFILSILSIWLFLYSLGDFSERTITSFCFWGLGLYITSQNLNLNFFDSFLKPLLISWIVLITLSFFSWEITYLYPIKRLCTLIGVFSVFALTKYINHIGLGLFLLKLSPYSMGIYLFHEMNLTFLQKFCLKFLPTHEAFLILEYFILPFFVCTICVFFCKMMKSFFPKTYSFITGGR